MIFAGTTVGTHEAPIKCVEYCPEVNVVITGSWDSTVKLWDPRTPCAAGSFSQPDKVGAQCWVLKDTTVKLRNHVKLITIVLVSFYLCSF